MLYIYNKVKYRIALALLVVFTGACWVQASTADAITYSWCSDTLRGNVGSSQPTYVKDNDIGKFRKNAEAYYDINIVSNTITSMMLEWGAYGSANGAIYVEVTFTLDTGGRRLGYFWCEKNGIYTDWPVGWSKWGVYNP